MQLVWDSARVLQDSGSGNDSDTEETVQLVLARCHMLVMIRTATDTHTVEWALCSVVDHSLCVVSWLDHVCSVSLSAAVPLRLHRASLLIIIIIHSSSVTHIAQLALS